LLDAVPNKGNIGEDRLLVLLFILSISETSRPAGELSAFVPVYVFPIFRALALTESG